MIESGMLRAHHSSTFTLEEGELKAYMSKNEGINAGAAPEEDEFQNGQQVPLAKRPC
jgi:hypothetical protein